MTTNGVSGMISLFELPPSGQVGIGLRGPGRPATGGRPGGRILGALRGLGSRIALARQKAALMRDLSRLSDRDLADIGLSRATLPQLFDRR